MKSSLKKKSLLGGLVAIMSLTMLTACSSNSSSSDNSGNSNTSVMKKKTPSVASLYDKANNTDITSFTMTSKEKSGAYSVITWSDKTQNQHAKAKLYSNKYDKWITTDMWIDFSGKKGYVKGNTPELGDNSWLVLSGDDSGPNSTKKVKDRFENIQVDPLNGYELDNNSPILKNLKVKSTDSGYTMSYSGNNKAVFKEALKYLNSDWKTGIKYSSITPVNVKIVINTNKNGKLIDYTKTFNYELDGESFNLSATFDDINKNNNLEIPQNITAEATEAPESDD